jgi:hypothetical protein
MSRPECVGFICRNCFLIQFDTSALSHHDEQMRTTVEIPESLHQIAMGLARHTKRSLSQTVVDLMEIGLNSGSLPATQEETAVHPQTGLPLARSRRPVTEDDVRSVMDEQ